MTALVVLIGIKIHMSLAIGLVMFIIGLEIIKNNSKIFDTYNLKEKEYFAVGIGGTAGVITNIIILPKVNDHLLPHDNFHRPHLFHYRLCCRY